MVWKEPGKDKDPWESEGRGSAELEKLMSDLQRRLTSVFKPRRRGPNRAVLWLIPVAVLIWLLTGCYLVDAGDRGVEFFLGRFQSVTAPGLHWHLPWPLGASLTVEDVDQGADYVRGYAALLTADGNAVTAEVSVHYNITDLPQYLFSVAGPTDGNAAVDVLGDLTDAAVSATFARTAMPALTDGDMDAVEASVRDTLLAEMKTHPLGLTVSRVTLAKVSAPGPVASAYAAVRKAEVAAEQQSDAADAYAADALPKARGEADSRVDAAKSAASDGVQRAQADAAAFRDVLAAYHRAPAVTRETLYLSTLEQIIGQVDRVVVVGKGGHVTLSFDTKPEGSKPPAPVSKPAGKAPVAPTAGGGHP